jgi:rfaE bifunctional protein nucleotidyltransferase chain/domain
MPDETKDLKSKQIHFTDINKVIKSLRPSGKKIALCHGVFDLLHPGHLRHFSKAKEVADIVIVSITADKDVNKGPGRPAFSEDLRSESLSNLITVDYVVITPFPTAIEIIDAVKPDYYVKGADYLDEKGDKTGNISKEKAIAELNGGKLIYTNEIVFSSSNLLNNFISKPTNEVASWIKSFKSRYSTDEIIGWLDEISKLKVVVVGEAIIDVYTECEALGKSAKDPILCFNKGPSVTHAGGSLAIAAHARGLGLDTTLITGLNLKDKDLDALKKLKDRDIELKFVDISPHPTIRKERLVDLRTSTKVLELYEMMDVPLSPKQELQFDALISESVKNSDVIIVADYGHGLISDNVVKSLSQSGKFLAVNTQVNAGNKGINSISRYPKFNFATFNGSEVHLETRKKTENIDSFISQLQSEKGAENILVTKGGGGLDIFTVGKSLHHSPALAPFVKDRVGAGDAVLTITSLLAAVRAPRDIVGLLGNICGAWAVSFLGNEKNLDSGDLARHVKALLA